ncbi:MAG: ABC transporter ATP-binding protein [Chloroflexi bacterium]|nr:ABC transporter ATP-binding protein [Chloroflexota bacterium]
MTGGLLEVDGLGFRHADAAPDAPPAIEAVSFSVPGGSLVAVVGPSGSGKTTLLRCVAGLVRPTAGEIRLDGRPIDGVPDATAVVFQDYGRSLFPWMSVADNVDLPLRRLGLAPAERRTRVSDALAEVGLAGTEASYPWQLSGGMQQRVAIARAMAYRPRLLLMDEPFASVDAQVRADLQELTLSVWQAHGSTVLFVTHDIDEAVYLADRVVVLSPAPARVAADVAVGLPRPRDQIATRSSAAFVELRARVARLIRR